MTRIVEAAAAVILQADGRFLLGRRPEGKPYGGYWEFPGGKIEPGETEAEAAMRECREELGVEVEPLAPLMTVRHTFTHFRVTLHVLHCRYVGGEPRCLACSDWRWETVDRLRRYAFPAANRRIIAALEAGAGGA